MAASEPEAYRRDPVVRLEVPLSEWAAPVVGTQELGPAALVRAAQPARVARPARVALPAQVVQPARAALAAVGAWAGVDRAAGVVAAARADPL